MNKRLHPDKPSAAIKESGCALKVHRYRKILLALLLAMFSCLAPAQPLTLTELPEESLGKWSEFLVEDAAPLSLSEARKRQHDGLFHPIGDSVLSHGIGSRPLWLHLELVNPANQSLPLRLETGATWLDRLDVYIVRDNQVMIEWHTGDTYPDAFGLTAGTGFSFAPDFAPGRSDLYIRAESIDPMVLPVRLMTEKQAVSGERLTHYGYGFLYGYLLALIAYNGMLFAGLRERSYLYYSLYLASLVLTNIAYTGHGAAIFWPDQPQLQRYAILFLMVLYGSCGLLFASRFLALAEHAPRILRLVRASSLSGLALVSLSILAGSQLGAALIAFSFVALFSVGMVLLGIHTVRHGRVDGYYFLLATLFGMFGTALTTISVWGWLPFNTFTFHGAEYGIAIEATLLALALTHRFNEMNARLSVLTVSRDELATEVAERKRAEERSRESEEALRESQLAAGLGSYVFDIPAAVWKSSDMLDRVFGIDGTYPHTLEGWLALLHPDDRTAVYDYLQNEVLAQGQVFDKEYRIIRPNDQAERWVHGLGKLKFDDHGRPHKMFGTINDITERKLAAQKADDLNRLNEAIVVRSPAGIAVYRASGQCVRTNEAYAKSIGGTEQEILQQDFRNNNSWKRNGLLACADQVLTTGLPLRRDVEGITSFGRKVVLEVIFAPISIANSPHLLVITNDILARIAAEQALTESMHKLEEKELAKSRFLAAAGHDLRQPLAAANLFIDALKFTDPNPEQTHIIERLDQSMTTFNGLLDALLNVSKLDAGMIKPEFTGIDVAEIFNWVEQNFAPLASEKQVGLRLHFPKKPTLAVHSDTGLLKSALMNLISNAIKFTAHGAVLVCARLRGNEVLFQVWDTGSGIPQEQLGKIFDEFYQVDNPQRDRAMGLGLGLSIARRALLLLGRNISCRSRLEHGSVFEFSLPLAGTDQAPIRQEPLLNPEKSADNLSFVQGKRFMVVEDDTLVSEALGNALKAAGGKVKCFHTAEYALQHAHIEPADYYIADYMLGSTLNGIQFLGMLRQRLGKPIKAVIMTGDTSTAFVREAAQCDWPILHKPVNIAALLSTLGSQEGR